MIAITCFMFNLPNVVGLKMDPLPLYSPLFWNTIVPLGNCYSQRQVLSIFLYGKTPQIGWDNTNGRCLFLLGKDLNRIIYIGKVGTLRIKKNCWVIGRFTMYKPFKQRESSFASTTRIKNILGPLSAMRVIFWKYFANVRCIVWYALCSIVFCL